MSTFRDRVNFVIAESAEWLAGHCIARAPQDLAWTFVISCNFEISCAGTSAGRMREGKGGILHGV